MRRPESKWALLAVLGTILLAITSPAIHAQPTTASSQVLSGAREPVRVASTADIDELEGLLTIDGITLEAGDRVLVKDQTDTKLNGIYTVTAGQWQRAPDARAPRAITKGVVIRVQEGSTNENETFRASTINPTIGADPIEFELVTNTGDVVDVVDNSVSTAKLQDEAVTNEKIDDLAITTSKLASSSVSTTKIQDDAVTIGKMEHATQGQIIYYGSSGVPARLSVGSAGQVLRTQGSGANPVWGVYAPLLHIQDQKSAGTAGGTFTSGSWQTRTLNTEVTDEIGSTCCTSNRFTLPSGTYEIDAYAPIGMGGTSSIYTSQARLYNITDSTVAVLGSSMGSSDNPGNRVRGRFTISGTKTFELQHQISSTLNTTGLGRAADLGSTEIYSDVMVRKVQ